MVRAARRRHPAQVTAARLGDAHERWYDYLEPADLDAIGHLIQVLEQIASGEARKIRES